MFEVELVKEIREGRYGSSLSNFTVIGKQLLFTAYDDSHGLELWVTDGTGAGTALVKDIEQGKLSSSPRDLRVLGGQLFFFAYDSANDYGLWVSDGTEAGTILVKDIKYVNDNSRRPFPDKLTLVGDQLFFYTNDGITGRELWVSDGTEAGTKLVKDIRAGITSSIPEDFTVVEDRLFFIADDGNTGRELWVSDGTEAGTQLVKDIMEGSGSSNIWEMTAMGNRLFFSAQDDIHGRKLWVTDGTEAGTLAIEDANSEAFSSPGNLTVVGDQLFFSAYSNVGHELWVTNGTKAGTTFVKDIREGITNSEPANFTAVGNLLFLSAIDDATGHRRRLYVSDGTEAGTQLVESFDGTDGAGFVHPKNLTALGEQLFFATHVNKLWVSDGTQDGTKLLKAINPGTDEYGLISQSYPGGFVPEGNQLFFIADDDRNGDGLWVSDGTESGTRFITTLDLSARYLTPPITSTVATVGDQTFFLNNEGGGSELFVLREKRSVTDFNNDGTSDILWRSKSGDSILIWQMQDNKVVGTSDFAASIFDRPWNMAGTADFNGDGQLDLIGRNQETNAITILLLDDQQALKKRVELATLPKLELPGQEWQIIGVDDFNGDDQADIVWRNQTSGQFLTWYLGGDQGNELMGGALTDLSLIGLGTEGVFPDLNWQVKATGDFNDDNATDLVWQHQITGDISIWHINEQATLIGGYALEGVPDKSWEILGSGDYNSDSRPDLFWQHNETGETVIWSLRKGEVVGGRVLGTVNLDQWTSLI